MTVTIWDTTANAGAGGIARVATPVYTPDPQDPEGPGTTEIVYGDPLKQVAGSEWVRKPWHGTPAQADPRGTGALNFQPGWVILRDVLAPASVPAGQRRGPDRTVPLVDLEAGTAVWYTLDDLNAGELAAELALAISAKSNRVEAERSRRIYLPIGQVDVRGDGTLMVEPDIRNAHDEANLDRLSLRCTQLSLAGVTTAVVPFGDAANVQQMLTPVEMVTLAAAPFTRASELFVKARALKTALDGMTAAEVAVFDPADDANWA